MPDYQESAGQFTSWVRCCRVVCENPRPVQGVPAATFVEERVIVIDGEESYKPLGNLVEPFTEDNIDEVFNLVHPGSGAVIGQMAYRDLYVALSSAYLHVANKRDQGLPAPPAQPAE